MRGTSSTRKKESVPQASLHRKKAVPYYYQAGLLPMDLKHILYGWITHRRKQKTTGACQTDRSYIMSSRNPKTTPVSQKKGFDSRSNLCLLALYSRAARYLLLPT